MMRWVSFLATLAVLVVCAGDRSQGQQGGMFETMLVGVVVPDDIRPGDDNVATITLDPERYEGRPGLRVITAEIPPPSNSLTGNVVEVAAPSSDPQRRGELVGTVIDLPKKEDRSKTKDILGKIFLNAAQMGANQLPLLFRRPGSAENIATKSVPVTTGAPGTAKPAGDIFEMPSVIGSNDFPAITGPVGTNPQVSIGSTPVDVIAANPRVTYIDVPETLQPGASTVVVKEQPIPSMPSTPSTGTGRGTVPAPPVSRPALPSNTQPAKAVTFDDVTVVGVALKANGPTKVLSRGNETPIEATITGKVSPDLLDRKVAMSTSPYRIAVPPLKGAPRPGDKGKVGLVIENRSPQTVKLDGEQGGSLIKWFGKDDFARGIPTLKSKIIARSAGAYNIRARVVPALPPAVGKVAPSNAATTRP